MSPLTRREAMVKALTEAGTRGCTRTELMEAGGAKWRSHLRDIEADYYLRTHRSRFGTRSPFRWVLLAERIPEPAGEACELPPQLPLLTPSGRPAFEPTTSQRVDGTGRAPVASSILRRAA